MMNRFILLAAFLCLCTFTLSLDIEMDNGLEMELEQYSNSMVENLIRPKGLKNALSVKPKMKILSNGKKQFRATKRTTIGSKDKGPSVGNLGAVHLDYKAVSKKTTVNLDAMKEIVEVKCYPNSLRLIVKGGYLSKIDKNWKAWTMLGNKAKQTEGTILSGGFMWKCHDKLGLPMSILRKLTWKQWVRDNVLYIGTAPADVFEALDDLDINFSADGNKKPAPGTPATNATTPTATPFRFSTRHLSTLRDSLDAMDLETHSFDDAIARIEREFEVTNAMQESTDGEFAFVETDASVAAQVHTEVKGMLEMIENSKLVEEEDYSMFLNEEEAPEMSFVEADASSDLFLQASGWMSQCEHLEAMNIKKVAPPSKTLTLLQPSANALTYRQLRKGVSIQIKENAYKPTTVFKVELYGGGKIQRPLGSIVGNNKHLQGKFGHRLKLEKRLNTEEKSSYKFRFYKKEKNGKFVYLHDSQPFFISADAMANIADAQILTPQASQFFPANTKFMITWKSDSKRMNVHKCSIFQSDNKLLSDKLTVKKNRCEATFPEKDGEYYVMASYTIGGKYKGYVKSGIFTVKPVPKSGWNSGSSATKDIVLASSATAAPPKPAFLEMETETETETEVDVDAEAESEVEGESEAINFQLEHVEAGSFSIKCVSCSLTQNTKVDKFTATKLPPRLGLDLSGSITAKIVLEIQVSGGLSKSGTLSAASIPLLGASVPAGNVGLDLGLILKLNIPYSFSANAAGTITAGATATITWKAGATAGATGVTTTYNINKPTYGSPTVSGNAQFDASADIAFQPILTLTVGKVAGAQIQAAAYIKAVADAKVTASAIVANKKLGEKQVVAFTAAEGNALISSFKNIVGKTACGSTHLAEVKVTAGLRNIGFTAYANIPVLGRKEFKKNLNAPSPINVAAACLIPYKGKNAGKFYFY